MKTLWVLEYIAKFGDRKITDDFIATWTFPLMPLTPRCSHAELGFPDRGLSFSFTTRDGANGARFTDLKRMLRHQNRWLVTVIQVEDWQYDAIFEYCVGELGKSYSYYALLLGFTILYGTDGKKGNYCSRGGVAWPLKKGRVLRIKYNVISPRRLYKVLTKAGYKFVPLYDGLINRIQITPEEYLFLIRG